MSEQSEADLLLRITELSNAKVARELVAYAKRIRGPATLASVLARFVERLEAGELGTLVNLATKPPALLRAEREFAERLREYLAGFAGRTWDAAAATEVRAVVGALILRTFQGAPRNRVANAVMMSVRFEGRTLLVATADIVGAFWSEAPHA